MASVGVDPSAAGLPFGDISGEVVAMWYMGPANADVGDWAFSVSGLGLTEGEQLQAYNASYFGFEWVDIGTVTADASGIAHSDGGLKHLSTLILVRE